MGIPGLYRWMVDRYPNTLCRVAEDRSPYSKGPGIDAAKPNPNGVEFDNLYIDMNGIIHPCFHPEGLPAPKSYDDVFKSIFRYIERVFSIVRPRKLLFLSVDGVAPRAKMNHQRIRRFRKAREVAGKFSAVEVEGIGKAEGDKKLDSNVITPGTEFMALLSSALKYYVHWRMNVDPGWRHIKVILSDSSVAGEGEDKIMSYIRSQRNLPGYDPNTRHCLHGLDADLIMLALATHEIHLSILREVITNGQVRKGKHMKNRLDGKSYQKQSYLESMRHFLHDLQFEFFNIWVLREYLERELLPNVEGTDFERLIDDFVFICLFVGNDFLPCLPSLDISEGGIELLLIVYQEEFVKMGYLTNSSKVNLKSMEHFLQALGSHENAIFMKRCQVLMEKSKKKRRGSQDSLSYVKVHKKYMKQGYYTEKFDVASHDVDRIKRDTVLKYTEGVCWILHYYYQGVLSWQWFYPYHYAPFASDFCGLDKLEVRFTLGQPLKPLDQLLGVLPAASAQALPLFYRELMIKASSPILDFYPKDAKVDKNGKKYAWQGVCKLPFIEESRLLSETVKVEHTLTDEEKQRNRLGRDRLFVHYLHPLAKIIKNHPLSDPSSELEIKIKPELSGGMNGYLCISDKPVCPRTIPSPIVGKLMIKKNDVRSVDYKYPSSHAHIPNLPCGVRMPPRILRCQDSPHPPVLWHATPSLAQSIFSESPTKKSQKKRKEEEVQKGCMDENLAHAIEPEMQDHCVDKTCALAVELGMAPEQHGSKDGASGNYTNNEASNGKQNICDASINGKLVGKSEAELHLVEGRETICGASRNRFIVEFGKRSTDMIEPALLSAKQQQIMVGNDEHGIGDETQRDKQVKGESTSDNRTKIYKSSTSEKLMNEINIEICEKPTKRTVSGLPSTSEHESLCRENELDISGEPKRKQEKKRARGDELEAELHLVEGQDKVSGAGQNSTKVEVCEIPKTRMESVLPFAEKHEAKGEVHLVEGTEKICGVMQNIVSVEVSGAGQNSTKVEVCEKPKTRMESVLPFAEKHEAMGEVHLVEGTEKICGVIQKIVSVEVGEKPTNGIGSFLSYNNRQELVGETRLCTSVALNRKKHTKRRGVKGDKLGGELQLVEGKDKINGAGQNSVEVEVGDKSQNKMDSGLLYAKEQEIIGRELHLVGETEGVQVGSRSINAEVGEKPTNKMEFSLSILDEHEFLGSKIPLVEGAVSLSGMSQKVNFEVDEKLTNKMDCDLVPAKWQEIKDLEKERLASGEHKRKKQKKRKWVKHMLGSESDLVEEKVEISGLDQNSNGFEVSEKAKNKLKPDLPYAKEQEIVDGENEQHRSCEPSRDKQKTRKQVKDDMVGAELRSVEEKSKVNGASQSNSSVKARKKPTRRLESDLPFSREEENMGGENEGTSGKPEPKRKKHKRRQVKDDMLGAEPHLMEEKVEIVGASQSSNNVEVSEIPTNRLESDLLLPREQETVGGENEDGSVGEPKRKRQRKRRGVKGDVLGMGANLVEENDRASQNSHIVKTSGKPTEQAGGI